MSQGLPPHARARPCRSCRAPIFFATTAKNGRPIPINVTPKNMLRLEERAAGEDGLNTPHYVAHVEQVWEPHHATCPNAADWRKKG